MTSTVSAATCPKCSRVNVTTHKRDAFMFSTRQAALDEVDVWDAEYGARVVAVVRKVK